MRPSLAIAALLLAGGTILGPSLATAQTSGAPATAPNPAPAPAAPMSPPSSSNGAQTPRAALNTTPQTQSSSPSAVQTQNTTQRTAAAPVPGRNSFTMNQAVRRISAAGYTNVVGLKKDPQGIWRGQAQKDGSQVAVSLDYQGNVTSK